MPIPIVSAIPDYLRLKAWSDEHGTVLALSRPCIEAMLQALSPALSEDKNFVIHHLLKEASDYRFTLRVNEVRKRKTPKQRSKYWQKFSLEIAPAIDALERLLAKSPAPETFPGSGDWSTLEFLALENAVPLPTFWQAKYELIHPRWRANEELGSALRTLKWAARLAVACEAEATSEAKLKGRTPQNSFLSTMGMIYTDLTGEFPQDPYYDDGKEDWVGRFLDFVCPAVMELDDIERSGVARRLQRLRKYNEHNFSSGPRPAKRRGPRSKSGNLAAAEILLGSNNTPRTGTVFGGGIFQRPRYLPVHKP